MNDEDPIRAGFQPDLTLKPVIRELVRTQVCFSNLKLLVDRISVVRLPSDVQSHSRNAYRLYLSDGDRMIQALLKRQMQEHIKSSDIGEGSYVILRGYRLVKGKRLNGKGHVIYIIVDDFYSIGDEPRSQIDDIRQDLYCELIKTPAAPKTQREDRSSKDTRRRLFTSSSHENDDRQGSPLGNHFRSTDSSPASVMTKFSFENDASQSPSRNKSLDPSMTVAQTPVKTAKRMRSPYNDDLDSTVRASKILRANDRASYLHSPLEGPSIQRSKPSVQALAPRVSAEQIEKHLVEVRNEMTPDKDTGYGVREDGFTTKQTVETTVFRDPETPTKLLSGYTRVLSPLNANSPSSKFTSTISTTSKMLLSIKRPLNIRSLAAVTGVNASKNKVYDFFAVVAAVDASVVKPELMPLKRDIRIVDPSTEKRVLVSIFVDPVNFKPSVGTVALFRSLTTNRYDGGMLNAYPQHCGGKQWFIRDPVNAEGCDVLGLRKWWEEQSKP